MRPPPFLLRNENCARLWSTLEESPGQNIQELAEAIGVTRTAANYHVRRLMQAGCVVPLRQGPHLLHFPAHVPPAQRVALGLLRIPSIRATAQACFRDPHVSWSQVAERLQLTPRSVRRAVHTLQKENLLHLERNSSRRSYVAHLHPELRLVMARWAAPATSSKVGPGPAPPGLPSPASPPSPPGPSTPGPPAPPPPASPGPQGPSGTRPPGAMPGRGR